VPLITRAKRKFPASLVRLVGAINERAYGNRPAVVEISEPAGLCQRYWVSFRRGAWTRDIALERQGPRGKWCARDFASPSSGEFACGTIGALNGLNYPRVVPPPRSAVEWWVSYLRAAKAYREES